MSLGLLRHFDVRRLFRRPTADYRHPWAGYGWSLCSHLTFFRNREDARGGRAWTTWVDRPEGRDALVFYARQLPDTAAYLDEIPRDGLARYAQHKARLAEAIRQGGGGFLVELRARGRRLHLDITKVGAADGAYQGPHAVFHFDVFEVMQECPFPGETLALVVSETAHVVLPGDREAELKFRAFRQDFASWFTPDFEATMMEMMRAPALGARVEWMEWKLGKLSADVGKLSADDGQSHWWTARALPLAMALLAAAILLPPHTKNAEAPSAQAAAPAAGDPPQAARTPPPPNDRRNGGAK